MEYTVYPCQPYITRSLDVFSQERILEAAKCFANTYKKQGYDLDISYSLLASLSQTIPIGKPTPDFFLIDDISYTNHTYFDKLYALPPKPLTCGALYSRLDNKKQLCALCPIQINLEMFQQRKRDELALLSYLISSKENLSLVDDHDLDKVFQIKLDLLQDYTDVSFPLVIPLYRQVIKQYIKNNVLDFYEAMQLDPITYLRDALSVCLKNKKIPSGCLKHTFTTMKNQLEKCKELNQKEANILLNKLEESSYKELLDEKKYIASEPHKNPKSIPKRKTVHEEKKPNIKEKNIVIIDPFQLHPKSPIPNESSNVRIPETTEQDKDQKKITFTQETLQDILGRLEESTAPDDEKLQQMHTGTNDIVTTPKERKLSKENDEHLTNTKAGLSKNNSNKIIFLPAIRKEELPAKTKVTDEEIVITDNIIDGTRSFVSETRDIDDYLYNPVIPKEWLEKECLCLDSSPFLSSFETSIYKDKYVVMDAFLDDKNQFLFLLYNRYKRLCFYSYLESRPIRDMISSILSHKSIRKICVNPYMIYGTAAFFSCQVRNVFSIQLAYQTLHDNPGMVDEIFRFFCKKPKYTYHFDAASYLPLYFLAYRNSSKELIKASKQYAFKKAQLLQEAYGYSYVNRYLIGKNILFKENKNGSLIYDKLNDNTRSVEQGYFCSLHLKTISSCSLKELMEECLVSLAEEGRFRNIPFQLVEISEDSMTFYIKEDYCDYVISLLHVKLLELGGSKHLERYSIHENTRATNLAMYQ